MEAGSSVRLITSDGSCGLDTGGPLATALGSPQMGSGMQHGEQYAPTMKQTSLRAI